MGKFNRGGAGGRGRTFGNKREFNNRGFARPTLFDAICSKCGKECQVPFRPSGDKPVFCRDCFRENGGDANRSEERTFSQPNLDNRSVENSQYKEQLAALNIKLDKILSILNAAISPKDTSDSAMTAEPEIVQPREEIATKKKKTLSKKSNPSL